MKEILLFVLWNIKSIFARLPVIFNKFKKVIKAWGFKFAPLQEDMSLAKKDVAIKDMHFRIFGIVAIHYT